MPRPDPTPPRPEQVEAALLHDARAVHDVASLHFRDYETDGAPAWVLATITPGPRSGSATVPGAFIRAETGEFVVPRAAEPALVKEGSWKAIAAARRSEQHAQGDYSWTEPLQERRVLRTEDIYSPFVHGGTVLCRPTPGRPGLEQFGPVTLLFPAWGQYVAAASGLAEHHGGLFEAGGTRPGDAGQLAKVLAHENKLIAELAFRGLITSKAATPDLLRGGLARDDGPWRAILTELMLVGPEPGDGEPLMQAIVDLLRAARDATGVRPIALGSFSVALFRVNDPAPLARGRAVLNRARQRLKELSVPIETEPDLSLIFEKMGVPP